MTIRSDAWILNNFNNDCLYRVIKNNDQDHEMILDAEVLWKSCLYHMNKLAFNKFIAPLHNYKPAVFIEHKEWTISLHTTSPKGMIHPFSPDSVKYNDAGLKVPSFGLSSYGYDISLGRNFTKIVNLYKRNNDNPFDPLKDEFKEISHEFKNVDYIDIKPHEFVLGHSREYVKVPKKHTVTCMAKSTVARWGINASVTPIETEWGGYITIELQNQTHVPIRLHSGIGIMQLLFYEGDQDAMVSYADRGGKYQNQAALPIIARL